MKYTVVRAVRDDFEALHMSTAMMRVGLDPFAVAVNPRADITMCWHVFGKYDGDLGVEHVTKALDAHFDVLMGR